MDRTMEIEQALLRMMTCATVFDCAREEACFAICQWARTRLAYDERERLQDARHREPHLPPLLEVEEDDEIEHYAPHLPPLLDWEWARPDWDAA